MRRDLLRIAIAEARALRAKQRLTLAEVWDLACFVLFTDPHDNRRTPPPR